MWTRLRVVQAGLRPRVRLPSGGERGTGGQAVQLDFPSLQPQPRCDPLVRRRSRVAPTHSERTPASGRGNARLAGAARLPSHAPGLPRTSLGLVPCQRRAPGSAWRALAPGPCRRGHFTWQPGSHPDVRARGELRLDRPRHLRILRASATARGDSRLHSTWAGASTLREGAVPIAGGRFARHAAQTGSARSRSGLDSLRSTMRATCGSRAAHGADRDGLGGDGDGARAPERIRDRAKLVLEGPADPRSSGRHLQLGGVPAGGLYAAARAGHGGWGGDGHGHRRAIGTRASPIRAGRLAPNGAFGEFRAPFVDGTFDYHGRASAWSLGQQILESRRTCRWTCPRARCRAASSRHPFVGAKRTRSTSPCLEALTPSLQHVTGVFSADLGIAGTWDAPRLRGELQIANPRRLSRR